MIKQQFIDQLTGQIGKLAQTIPLGDLEQNIKALLQAGFSKLDLVNRNEFEVQQQVLLQTRQKLEELEQQIHRLEQTILKDGHS